MTTKNVATIEATNAPTIKAVLAMPIEALQAKPLEELNVLHTTLKASADKKAHRKADLIQGIMNGMKKALKAVTDTVQGELLPIENSVKAKPKAKKAPSKKAPVIKNPEAHAVAEQVEAPTEAPKATTKKAPSKKAPTKKEEAPATEEAPKAPKSLKRIKKAKPNMDEMTAEQLKEYAKSLEEKTEDFPSEINGEKSAYTRIEFDTLKEIQDHLIKKPMTLFMLVDEKLDENLTHFLVLFANTEIIVLLDRNREKNSTITVKQDKLDAEHITMDKIKFKYSFYARKATK
jgi:hypothetical protein